MILILGETTSRPAHRTRARTTVLTVTLYAVSARLALAAAVAYHVSVALFVGFAVAAIVRDIFRHRSIGLEEIVGAFCGYMMLGVVWGSLYVLVELLAPGAFAVSPDIRWQLDDMHLRRSLFNYVSFATMALPSSLSSWKRPIACANPTVGNPSSSSCGDFA